MADANFGLYISDQNETKQNKTKHIDNSSNNKPRRTKLNKPKISQKSDQLHKNCREACFETVCPVKCCVTGSNNMVVVGGTILLFCFDFVLSDCL